MKYNSVGDCLVLCLCQLSKFIYLDTLYVESWGQWNRRSSGTISSLDSCFYANQCDFISTYVIYTIEILSEAATVFDDGVRDKDETFLYDTELGIELILLMKE